ncbi:MAG TPA: hypothetical protein VK146_08250 [Tabrizicola sp.]|nr:hypothetical protein [Tabrizicola sp.]
MFKRLQSWWRAEGDLVKIAGMNDRLLQDMGLDRSALRDLVHGRTDPRQTEHECYRHPLKAVPVR